MGALYWMADQPQSMAAAMTPGPIGNLLHIPINLVLAIFVLRAVSPPGPLLRPGAWYGLRSRAGLACCIIVFLHGVLDESHQFYTGRTCSVLDILLDGCGALILLLLPVAASAHRPSTWKPVIIVAVSGILIAIIGWMARPWPDRVLEQLLQSIG